MGKFLTQKTFNENNLLFSMLFVLLSINARGINDFYQNTWTALLFKTQGTYKQTNLKAAEHAAALTDTIPPVLHGLPRPFFLSNVSTFLRPSWYQLPII